MTRSRNDPRRVVEFDKLNPAGKVIYVAGTAVEVATGLLGLAVGTLGFIWEETERAFRDGLGERGRDGMDDARILEEFTDP